MSNNYKNILFTDSALIQIGLILENDFTVENKVFRIKIDGKGCEGFTYAMGFSDKDKGDNNRTYSNPMGEKEIVIAMDPFTTFYVKNARIDFLLDPELNEDGFTLFNYDQEKYHGKFFKDESMVPSHLEEEKQ